jgi:hypothetical protein
MKDLYIVIGYGCGHSPLSCHLASQESQCCWHKGYKWASWNVRVWPHEYWGVLVNIVYTCLQLAFLFTVWCEQSTHTLDP